ncbi:MAG: PilN domain-containing protein [Acidobacteriota bacterium]
MIKINLVAEGRKPAVARKSKSDSGGGFAPSGDLSVYFLAGGFVLGLLVFGVWWFLLNSQIKENNRNIGVAEQRVAELEPFIRQVDEAEAKEAALVQKIDVITDLKNKQSGPVEVMDEVSKALPELLWVDRLDQRGATFVLSGRAYNDQAVSNFLANLDAVSVFNEPVLVDMNRSSGSDVFNYTINFTKITSSDEDEDEL